jgi:hypothetical protein
MPEDEQEIEARAEELADLERTEAEPGDVGGPGPEDGEGAYQSGTVSPGDGTDPMGMGTLDEGATGRLEGK